MSRYGWQFYAAAFFFVICIVVLCIMELTSFDFVVSDLLYQESIQQWLVSANNQSLHFIFYDGIKTVYIGVILIVLVALFAQKVPNEYKKGAITFVVSVILITSLVGLLKASTNMACPKDLMIYSGDVVYKKLFDFYSISDLPSRIQRCFPAGHAGLGYAFISLAFIPVQVRNKVWLGTLMFVVGSCMGVYKMVIGDHFISHTLVSLFISLTIIFLVNGIVEKYSSTKKIRY
ncbi:MAG: phosphatase PAP2 family protein [Pseudomonadota bacterium]|nr:phosphatase PAP2 family protein [Pseudomonadota bacterium]